MCCQSISTEAPAAPQSANFRTDSKLKKSAVSEKSALQQLLAKLPAL
jgi:hypothetical protein